MPGSLKTWNKSWDPQQGKSPKEQAQIMLADIKAQQAQDPEAKIAILYAANGDQTQQLNQQNSANNGAGSPGYDANTIAGAGQAEVFKELIDLINTDPNLSDEQKKKIRILPITTCKQAGSDSDDNGTTANHNAVTEAELQTDLDNIQQHVDQGWQVVAPPRLKNNNGVFQRPDPVNPNDQFGFGGGVAKAFTNAVLPGKTQTRNDIIQQGLNAIAAKNIAQLQQPQPQQQQPAPGKTTVSLESDDKSPESSSHLTGILKDYNEIYAKEHKLPLAKEVDGKVNLQFNTDKDAVEFAKTQAEKGRSFIVKNDKGEVLGFSKDNQFFNANGTLSNGKDFGKPMPFADFQKPQQQQPAPVALGAATNSTTNVVETIKDKLIGVQEGTTPDAVQTELEKKSAGDAQDPEHIQPGQG